MSLEELKNDQDAIETWFDIVRTDDVSKIENYANNFLAEGEKLEDLIKLESNSGNNALMIASKEGKVKSFEWLIEHKWPIDHHDNVIKRWDDNKEILIATQSEKKEEIITIFLKEIITQCYQKGLYRNLINIDIDIDQLDNPKTKSDREQNFFKIIDVILSALLSKEEKIDEPQHLEIKVSIHMLIIELLDKVSRSELFNKADDKVVQKLKDHYNNPTSSKATVKTPEEIVDDFYSDRDDIARFQKKDNLILPKVGVLVSSLALPVAAGVGLYKLLPKYFGAFQNKTKLLTATIGGAIFTFATVFLGGGVSAVTYEKNKYANRVTGEIMKNFYLKSNQHDFIKSEVSKRASEEQKSFVSR